MKMVEMVYRCVVPVDVDNEEQAKQQAEWDWSVATLERCQVLPAPNEFNEGQDEALVTEFVTEREIIARVKPRDREPRKSDAMATVLWDRSLSLFSNHALAALKLCDQLGWRGRWVSAPVANGFIFVLTGERNEIV